MAKRKKTGGRKTGSTNKTTAEVKAALEFAFDDIGGKKKLAQWGKENPSEFYAIWAKMLPKNIDVSGEVTHRIINIVRAIPKGGNGPA